MQPLDGGDAIGGNADDGMTQSDDRRLFSLPVAASNSDTALGVELDSVDDAVESLGLLVAKMLSYSSAMFSCLSELNYKLIIAFQV